MGFTVATCLESRRAVAFLLRHFRQDCASSHLAPHSAGLHALSVSPEMNELAIAARSVGDLNFTKTERTALLHGAQVSGRAAVFEGVHTQVLTVRHDYTVSIHAATDLPETSRHLPVSRAKAPNATLTPHRLPPFVPAVRVNTASLAATSSSPAPLSESPSRAHTTASPHHSSPSACGVDAGDP